MWNSKVMMSKILFSCLKSREHIWLLSNVYIFINDVVSQVLQWRLWRFCRKEVATVCGTSLGVGQMNLNQCCSIWESMIAKAHTCKWMLEHMLTNLCTQSNDCLHTDFQAEKYTLVFSSTNAEKLLVLSGAPACWCCLYCLFNDLCILEVVQQLPVRGPFDESKSKLEKWKCQLRHWFIGCYKINRKTWTHMHTEAICGNLD